MDYEGLKNTVTSQREARKQATLQAYNDLLATLQGQEAQQKQQAIQQEAQALQGAEAQKRNITQNVQDVTRSNRIRARAVGGASSSGYLELQNRAEREASQQAGGVDLQYGNQIASIQNSLNEKISAIQADVRKSQREKDLEIANIENSAMQELLSIDKQAQEERARRSAEAAYLSQFQGFGQEPQIEEFKTPDVLGASATITERDPNFRPDYGFLSFEQFRAGQPQVLSPEEQKRRYSQYLQRIQEFSSTNPNLREKYGTNFDANLNRAYGSIGASRFPQQGASAQEVLNYQRQRI